MLVGGLALLFGWWWGRRSGREEALLLEERRRMLQAWADYLQRAEADNVVSFQRSGT